EGGRVCERLDAQFHQVGGVFVVARPGRVVVGAVRRREQVTAGGVAAGRVHRVGGIGHLLGAVVVVEVALVEELAGAVGAGARDRDRGGVPARLGGVFQLRGAGDRLVENRRARPRRCAFFARQRRRAGRVCGGERRGQGKDQHARGAGSWSP